ncbi:50S ribosomal protein L13 [Candidatus Woesearchaeota archaeon]|nr:50S ribosomal protein L13 [Candidatus Woesearchaeota archaeon]
MEIYIDATNLILGRLASYAAKKAILGCNVKIFNCEKAVITGNKAYLIKEYAHKRQRGNPSKGPFVPRIPDRFVRRVVRGMVPYKISKGREAYKRVMCYVGVPENFKDKKLITIPSSDISKTKSLRFLSVKEICASMGGRV